MSESTRRGAIQAAAAVGGAVLLGTLAQGAQKGGEGPKPLKVTDYAKEEVAALEAIKTTADFCAKWKDKIRSLLVAAVGILKLFAPNVAKALELAIAFIDAACAGM
jgi:hypothetical protein